MIKWFKNKFKKKEKKNVIVTIFIIVDNEYDRRKYFNLFRFMLSKDEFIECKLGRDFATIDTLDFRIQFFIGKNKIQRGHKFHYVFDLTKSERFDEILAPCDIFEMIPSLSYYKNSNFKELFKGLR